MKIRHTIRASSQHSSGYINNLCNEFAKKYAPAIKAMHSIKEITAIDFAKQDMRGAPSITVFDERHCVPHQRHFSTYAEMIAFMQGYLQALDYGMRIAKECGLDLVAHTSQLKA